MQQSGDAEGKGPASKAADKASKYRDRIAAKDSTSPESYPISENFRMLLKGLDD